MTPIPIYIIKQCSDPVLQKGSCTVLQFCSVLTQFISPLTLSDMD